MRTLRAEWLGKRWHAKVVRAADDMLTERVKEVVGDRVARLRVAADNLDQQRSQIEQAWIRRN